MPPRKRKHAEATPTTALEPENPPVDNDNDLEKASKKFRRGGCGEEETTAYDGNAQKGIFRLPVELQEEILDSFQHPTLWTTVGYHGAPVISPVYNERNEVLRTLASTCVKYREVFLPRLWQHVLICTIGEGTNSVSFYKTVGEMLQRKCQGLLENPEIAVYVQ